jgi:DNA primase
MEHVAAPIAWDELDGILAATQFELEDGRLLLQRSRSGAMRSQRAADQALSRI